MQIQGAKGKRETIISPGREYCTESKARNSLCFSSRIDTCCKCWQSKYTGLAPSTSILLQPSRKHIQVVPGEGQSCQPSMCATGRQQRGSTHHQPAMNCGGRMKNPRDTSLHLGHGALACDFAGDQRVVSSLLSCISTPSKSGATQDACCHPPHLTWHAHTWTIPTSFLCLCCSQHLQ